MRPESSAASSNAVATAATGAVDERLVEPASRDHERDLDLPTAALPAEIFVVPDSRPGSSEVRYPQFNAGAGLLKHCSWAVQQFWSAPISNLHHRVVAPFKIS
jgi:hypothetical protein